MVRFFSFLSFLLTSNRDDRFSEAIMIRNRISLSFFCFFPIAVPVVFLLFQGVGGEGGDGRAEE